MLLKYLQTLLVETIQHGGIQLLRSHLGKGGGGESVKILTYANRGIGEGCQINVNVSYKFFN